MKVFYDPRQNAPSTNFSPSPKKPALVVEAWKKAGILLDITSFKPLTQREIALAHDWKFVDGVLNRKIANGFGNKSAEVATSLPWTTGSFASAAQWAATTKESSASPTSGFHHACWDCAQGYCTFNGLVIAARLVRQWFEWAHTTAVTSKIEPVNCDVGILDCDVHYGNGTDSIIDHLGLKYIRHWTFGAQDILPATADVWLKLLPKIVRSFAECRVLLYQAGADPHIDDPLGGVLTSAQLRERDRVVFQTCAEIGLPVAWNLAGGYQEPIEKVLAIHVNTALECAAASNETN